jgi:hypothetical protein
MKTSHFWLVCLVLVIATLLLAFCAAPPMPSPTPSPGEPVATTDAATPEPTDEPVIQLPEAPGKPPLNIDAVLDAYPLPEAYQELPVAADAALGFGYTDGLLGLIVAPVTELKPGFQHPDNADLGMPLGVAWRSNPFFTGAYVVTVQVDGWSSEQASGFLIGTTAEYPTATVPIVFRVEPLQTTAAAAGADLSPVGATIRSSETCFLLQQERPTPLLRLCSDGKTGDGETLLVSENPENPRGARLDLIAQVEIAAQQLNSRELLSAGQRLATEEVIGDIEQPGAIKQCDPTNSDPPGSCATDLIAAPIKPPEMGAAGRTSGLSRTLSQFQPNVRVDLGVLSVQADLPETLLNGETLRQGSYVVHTMTDASGNLIIPVMVSGVTVDNEVIVDQRVVSVEAPLVNASEDAGVAEIAMCKLWKACLFWEKCSK